MQIKTVRYHYTPISLAKLTTSNAGEIVELQELSFAGGGSRKGTAPLEDSLAVSYQNNSYYKIQQSHSFVFRQMN